MAHLDALAVVEQHVAKLLGHHVQVSLLALVGSGEHVEFGEVGGHVVERSAGRREREGQLSRFKSERASKASYCTVGKKLHIAQMQCNAFEVKNTIKK